jgi:DNA-binding CsgD family transcriptional regulator
MNLLVELKVRLTGREAEVLNLLSKGMRIKEVANILRIDRRTVHMHWSNAARKLSASNVTEAVANAIRLGILE